MRINRISKRIVSWLLDFMTLGGALIVLYLLIQLFFISSFKVPSNSMEPTLWPGDFILVDKCSKGARLFDVSAALKGKEVKIRRMPGWRQFRRGDVLVFNFPYPERTDSIGFDVMLYYVKRCLALPGDTLEIRRSCYRVNGTDSIYGNGKGQRELQRLIDSGLSEKFGLQIEAVPGWKKPGWSIAEFGPLYIPQRGSRVAIDTTSVALYGNLIEWEQRQKLSVRSDSVLLGDSLIREYRFAENYYFMAGDNVFHSNDSRYWGLLPESFIVGRVLCVWLSIDPATDKLRCKRLFKRICG